MFPIILCKKNESIFAVVRCVFFSLFHADPVSQLCVDYLVTYIIGGCIAVVLICISVVVLCSCCCVARIAQNHCRHRSRIGRRKRNDTEKKTNLTRHMSYDSPDSNNQLMSFVSSGLNNQQVSRHYSIPRCCSCPDIHVHASGHHHPVLPTSATTMNLMETMTEKMKYSNRALERTSSA